MLAGQNQFASGGLLLMIIGGLSVYLRAVPMHIWGWVVEHSTLTLTVKDDDAAFVWVKEWFLEQAFLKRIRRVDVDTTLRGEKLALVPAPGAHWFWHGGRPFRIGFYRSQESSGWTPKRQELFTFRTIGRKQSFLRQFVNEIVECHEKGVGARPCLFVHDEYWSRVQGYTPRRLESVILQPGEKERLIQDIEKFRASKQRYRSLGVPYHRGYLLYGPPGTGKTSLVSAVAAKFGMSIYALSLAEFNDKTLMKAMNDVDPNSVILFEDIDCMKGGKARLSPEELVRREASKSANERSDSPESFGVTLSGLLNALDGFSAPENVLYMMTSNRIEVLDPALLRPGRIDYRLYLGSATDEQKLELYRRFFPNTSVFDAEEFIASHPEVKTMAEFQGLLLGLEQDRASRTLQFALELPDSEPVAQ
jgi:chaperone BCS1